MSKSLYMCLFAVACCAAPSQDSTDVVSEDARVRLQSFMDIVLSTDLEGSVANIFERSTPTFMNDGLLAKLQNESWILLFDALSGDPYQYSAPPVLLREAEETKFLTHDAAIPEERVFEILRPLAAELSLPLNEDAYEIKFVDMGEFDFKENSEKDLYFCVWWITHDFHFRGLPCRDQGSGRGILIWLSAFSGRVAAVTHKPIVIPTEEERTVSVEDARTVVESWLGEQPFFTDGSRFPDDIASKIQSVVACANDFPEEPYSVEAQFIASKSYYCWEVPFEYRAYATWLPAVAWVRAGTGEVIGGQLRPQEPAK
jgi:hypothetical protein